MILIGVNLDRSEHGIQTDPPPKFRLFLPYPRIRRKGRIKPAGSICPTMFERFRKSKNFLKRVHGSAPILSTMANQLAGVESDHSLSFEAEPNAVLRFISVRELTEQLCTPLMVEDYVVQSMPDVSPTKWHLAHTSWFFETFLLKPHLKTYTEFDPHFGYLFNSYYNAIGDRTLPAKSGAALSTDG